jgi:tetratricopeptide (TPR) repeat protein
MRRYDEALHDFERTLKLTPNDAHAYGLRALVWAKKGDRSRALADFDEAIRLAPQNEELYRSHRDRVLAESSRAPIEGGDFSILKNPFVLLGLPPTAAPAMVKEAYEDAVEGGPAGIPEGSRGPGAPAGRAASGGGSHREGVAGVNGRSYLG